MVAVARWSEPIDTEALFRAHAAFVARFLVRLGVAKQELEDLVHDVFVVVHRAGGCAPGSARPTTWLAEIALRLASSRRRAIKRDATAGDEALRTMRAGTAGPLRDAAAREALERVQGALDGLDMEKKSVFILYELEGESCESIADGLQIPVGTVYSRLHHARREFLHAYRRLTGVDGWQEEAT